ncbi:MAG: hypothetical protein H4O13_08620 [Xanthomonadales bacterium]|nr:hypothetical protein [Xanthomonadales bacterium]
MKQIKARRVAKPAKAELTPRNLTLAALGVAAIARREGRGLLGRIENRSRRLAERVQLEAGAASGRVVELAEQVRSRVEQASKPLIARVEKLLGRTLKGTTKRKPAAKRAPARRAVKPAARKSTRRA